MCRPPNPAARNQFAHPAGAAIAAPPVTIKHSPITGTIDTEYAPPVMIPAPYSSSHVGASADCIPARTNTNVSSAPASNGGNNPSATFCPGPENSGSPRRLAFACIEMMAISAARKASNSQTFNHAAALDCLAAMVAAARAVAPRITCPHPGTAVNDADRSMVSRMKRRSSAGLADTSVG